MDPEQKWTYFTPGLSFPWTWLLLLRENTSLESMVSQTCWTQGRLKIWLPWRDVHDWGACVLQAGTLMLVHTDHWALDPSSYLQHTKEENAFYLLWCLTGLQWETWWRDTHERRVQSHDFSIFQVLIQSKWVNSDQPLLRHVCFLSGYFISLSLSPHLGMIGIIIFPSRLSWRFYNVFQCPVVLPGT